MRHIITLTTIEGTHQVKCSCGARANVALDEDGARDLIALHRALNYERPRIPLAYENMQH